LPKKDKPTKVDAPPPVQHGAGMLGVRKLVTAMAGSRLCYGEPVRAGERVVIPVARVSAAGGGGWGAGRDQDGHGGDGGGGGGSMEAAPVGFIDIGPEGARFEAIPDPMSSARALRTGATGLTTLAAAIAGYRALRRQHRAGGALPGTRRRLLSR
jgi:hypothetical protein